MVTVVWPVVITDPDTKADPAIGISRWVATVPELLLTSK